VKLLLDEMYPAPLAEGLQAAGTEAITVSALKLGGSSDGQVFTATVAGG
jgi:predicted nuclease of predicted toxin-antitoxin system